MQRNIIIYGGSFNPPTIGHQAVIKACLAVPDTDEVWLMPSGPRLDKPQLASAWHRLRMLERLKMSAFTGDTRLRVSDYELALPAPTMTYKTVKALERTFSDVTFHYVFGADSLAEMSTWQHGSWLKKHLSILSVARDGQQTGYDWQNVRVLPIADVSVSATMVRQALAAGQTVEHLLHASICSYIFEHSLYQAV